MKARLEAIDSLRAVASLSVMAFHYEGLLSLEWPKTWPDPTSLHLHLFVMGVELFFIISGFIIFMTLDRTQTPGQFIIGRAARIYPAYLASVVVSGAFLFAIGATTRNAILWNLTMLQSFFNRGDLIPPYWTLAYEVWFYTIMCGIFAIRALKKIEAICLGWLVAAFAVRIFLGDDFDMRVSLLSMIRFGHLFIAGMMLYRIVARQGSLLTFFVLELCVIYSVFGRNDWAMIPSFTWFSINLVLIMAVWLAAEGKLWSPSWLVRIGEASYSLYLFHVPVCLALIWLCDREYFPRVVAVAIAIPASLWIAVMARKHIEIPGQRLIKGLMQRSVKPA